MVQTVLEVVQEDVILLVQLIAQMIVQEAVQAVVKAVVKELVKEMDERISEAAPPKRHRIPPRKEISFEPESRSVRDRQASPYKRTTSQTAGTSAQPVRPATQTPIATEQTTIAMGKNSPWLF